LLLRVSIRIEKEEPHLAKSRGDGINSGFCTHPNTPIHRENPIPTSQTAPPYNCLAMTEQSMNQLLLRNMKKTFSHSCWLFAILLFSLLASASSDHSAKGRYLVFVGTYTDKGSQGIYSFRYDAKSGELTTAGLAAETENPSFLAIDKRGEFLYAVNETGKYKGSATGAIRAFRVDRHTGKLTLVNEVASGGADPCYLSFDKTGKFLLVANYTGGTVAALPIRPDGGLGEASSVLLDKGTLGPNRERQDAPHAHWIESSGDQGLVYVADLGLDRVLSYRLDENTGKLTAEKDAAVGVPGSGPRHAVVAGAHDRLYVMSEMDSSVTFFQGHEGKELRQVQHISALPAGFSGKDDAAEIVMSPGEKFLYTSNRGHDSIALFAVDAQTGKLELVENTSTQGQNPRHFEIDPTGTRLFVANQASGNIVVFQIDAKSGKLIPTGQKLQVSSPVCLKFVQAE
jgi:6-phosphogluconolactonase